MLQTLALETKPEVGAALKAKTSAHAQGELYLHFGKEGAVWEGGFGGGLGDFGFGGFWGGLGFWGLGFRAVPVSALGIC